MRLGEISKSQSDDLFGSENPLDRLRKYIRLKLPVYFEHGDDPADAYRDQPIIMANEQNFVYTTPGGMAYVPWTMEATRYHGGVKMDDWRFVQRNGDWILQQHFSEPKLSPVREESDDLFGPQRRTLTAREMSARMNLAAKQVGLDKILYRSGIADFGSGFEYHPIVSINQDGFQWANRNGTPIWATWEGRDEPRRWQYYRAPGTEGEYIFHLPIWDDDLDESKDDDLFGDQPVFYPGRHSLAVIAPDDETILRQFSNATVEDATKYVQEEMANWVAAGYGPDDYFSIVKVDDNRDDPWNEDDGTEEIKRIFIRPLNENDDDLFEPSGSLKVVSFDIPREMIYVRSALGLLGVKILNWDVIDNRHFTVDDHEVRSVNNHDIAGEANRNWYTAELGVEIADKFEKYADDWLTEVIPDDVRQAMAEKYFLEESDDDLFEPTNTTVKVLSWDIPNETVFVRSALGIVGLRITSWNIIDNFFTVDGVQVVSINYRPVTDLNQRRAIETALNHQVYEQEQEDTERWLTDAMPDDVLDAMTKDYKISKAIEDTSMYFRAQLDHLENYEARYEVDSETMDALREYIGQTEYLLQEFIKGGIAALDNALKNVYPEVVDSIDAHLDEHGIRVNSLNDLINQYRSNLQEEDDDLFAPPGRFQKIRQAILDTAKYYGAQLEYLENSPEAQSEVDSETMDALREYIGQAEYVLQEFIQGGIAAFDNALKNVYGEVVDSIDADLYRQGISLDDLINQYRSNLQEDDDLFGEIPMWRQVDRLVKAGQPVLFQWAEGVFYPVKKSNQYGFYWENSNGLDINTPWSTYVDHDAGNWTLSPNAAGNMILTDLDYLEESDDLFDELSEMDRLRRYFNTRHEIKIADQNGNVWTTVGFLRGQQTGQPLMKIQREYMSGYDRHTESLNMTENGLEGADIQPGPGGKIFVYLKPFKRTTIEEQDDDLFGEPTRRSKEIGEKLPAITQMMLALRQQNYQRAMSLATAHKLEIPPEYLVPVMSTLLQNPYNVAIALSYLTQLVHQRIPEFEPLLLNYIHDKLVNEPSAENYTAIRAVEYLSSLAQARIPGLEEIFSSLRTVRQKSSAKTALVRYGSNSAAADQWITRTLLPTWKSPEATSFYLTNVHQGQRIQALEPIVLKKADPALHYATYNIKQRWPRAEPIIASRGDTAYYYALYFFKPDRWPEAEPVIARDRVAWSMYARDFLGVNNHTKAGRAQRDAWREQLLAGQPMTPPPQGPGDRMANLAQQQQNPNPINEQDDELFEPQQLPRVSILQQLINNQSLKLRLSWGGKIYDVINVAEVPENVDPYTSHLAGWYEFLVRDEHGLTTITVDPKDHELVKQKDSWLVKERDQLAEDGDDDLFGPAKLPSVARLKNILDVQNIDLLDGNRQFEVYDVNAVPDDEFERMAAPGMIGWYEFQVNDPDQQGIHVRILDPKELVLDTSQNPYIIKPKPTLTESDDDLFEPRGVTPNQINRLIEQHGRIYLQAGTGGMASIWEIEEAYVSEYPGDIELALTTEWGETILRNYPQKYLSIDYSLSPPRVLLGQNQLEEAQDDLFGEPTKMAYVSRLVTALKNFAQEFTIALSDEEKKNIKYAMIYYEKGDFIAGNAYLFDLYEDNLERLKQYLWDRNLLASQQRQLPGTLTLRESDDDLFHTPTIKFSELFNEYDEDELLNLGFTYGEDPEGDIRILNNYIADYENFRVIGLIGDEDNLILQLDRSSSLEEDADDELFEPQSPKKIAMALNSAIDAVMAMIASDPIGTMDNGDRATRELQLLKFILQGVDRGSLRGALELMLDLDDNTQEEIAYQLNRNSGMDIHALRRRYLDENDDDLFEPNQRLQIYRAVRAIADRFEELNTPNFESMQDLVERYRRIADEFRKSMDQGYRAIWHILSGKYYWQRDLLFNNLKTPYGIDIEDQFLDWVEQGRQLQNR